MVSIISSRGDRSLRSLVNLDEGLIAREIYVNRGHLPAGVGADIRPRVALPRPREPGPQPRRLRRLPHGRGGDPHHARQEERGPRVHQHLPPPRYEGLPLRRRQHARLHMPLPRLVLRHRRQARRCPAPQAGLPRGARQEHVGTARGRPALQLLRLAVGDVGPQRPLVRGLPRRLCHYHQVVLRELRRRGQRRRALQPPPPSGASPPTGSSPASPSTATAPTAP